MTDISRRQVLTGLVAGAAAAGLAANKAAANCGTCAPKKEAKPAAQACCPGDLAVYKNEDFYKSDGTFDVDAAKKAYWAMMKSYNYPIVPRLQGEEFWAIDFGIGQFTEVGMAGIMWVNEKTGDYLGHEIFLLPGQQIAEHRHMDIPNARAKRESWLVRHGSCWTYGEGKPNPGDEERLLPIHKDIAKARSAVYLEPGEVSTLAEAEQWHSMLAGPKGAIVTEFASFHDNDALRFTHPKITF